MAIPILDQRREQLRVKEEIPCCSSSTNATLYYLVSIVTLIYNRALLRLLVEMQAFDLIDKLKGISP